MDATKVHPKVIQTKFTDAADEIQIELKHAYDVPELRKLIRTLNYSRAGAGEVVIRDAVSFASPQTFEVAIPTLGSFRRVGERSVEFEFEGRKLFADIQTPDGFELTSERIEELGAPAFTRLGFKLLKPVHQAEVVVTFKPVAETAGLFPAGVKRVLFLGDSITYSGQYVETVAAYHKARFPGQQDRVHQRRSFQRNGLGPFRAGSRGREVSAPRPARAARPACLRRPSPTWSSPATA